MSALILNVCSRRNSSLMALHPLSSFAHVYARQIDEETMEMVTLFWGAPKSLWMVTASMKLEDASSLEGKL